LETDATLRRSTQGVPPDPRVRRSLIFVNIDGGAVVGFRIGQKVVYPNHGIGTIEQIEQKQIGATLLPFYTLRLAANNSLVLVPVPNASEVGLRAPISSGECELLLKTLADDFSSPANDWKDRFKEFSDKMRTGDIFEVANVLKHLTYLSHTKPLSFREQRMLERSRYLVISELAAVCRQPECNVTPRVEDALARACAKHDRRPSKIRAAGAVAGH
jgi:CarD family transcriptional regulator